MSDLLMVWPAIRRSAAAMVLVATILISSPILAQAGETRFVPISTDTPRASLSSIQQLSDEIGKVFLAFQSAPSPQTQAALDASTQRLVQLLDLSLIPPIEQREKGILAATTLVDVLSFADPDAIDRAPGSDGNGVKRWTVPGTEVTLRLVEDGARQGEYLVDTSTVARLEDYAGSVETQRLLNPDGWAAMAHRLHGWMIPASTVAALPGWALVDVFGDPLWKFALASLVSLLTTTAVLLIHRLTWPASGGGPISGHLLHMVTPLAIVVGTYLYVPLIQDQVFVLGQFSTLVDVVAPLLGYLGTAWLAWHIVFVLTEFAIRNPRIPTESLDANLMRLAARLLGIAAVVFCLVKAAEGFGVPVVGIAAGLGAGGLAFGLAAQGTIENLIGALTIYFDRPVNVGDYCRVAGIEGTVESIGLRSSAIRTLDRSLVTLPNSVIVKAEIQNYSRRDTFLFRHTFRLPMDLEPRRIREVSDAILAVLSVAGSVRQQGPIAPRAPVVAISEWSVDIDVLAYLAASDYGEFLGMQDDLIEQLAATIADLGIKLAVPASVTRLKR